MKRRLLIVGVPVVVALGAAIAVYAYNESQPTEKRGSAREEFDTRAAPPPERPRRRRNRVPWPTYAFDVQRTHVAAGLRHRPPFRRIWSVDAGDTIEFPPSIGYGRAYVAQQKGRFLAVRARTGRLDWQRRFKRCAASSPTLWRGIVYQAYMDFVPCPQDRPGATGFLIAMDARTGRQRWRFNAAPIESSPLVARRTVYFGAWDHKVYALDARTGRRRWSFEGDEQFNTSAAYWRGTVYIASDGGTLYALRARTGRLRWKAQSNAKFGSREFFYATPTVAYGRVYIGNTDGTMYVYGARSGRLLWARPLGTYVYSAAAVWKRRVYVGTYDGNVFALDAATGDVRWRRPAPGAVHAAPTVMAGIVYFATCSTCGTEASRSVKRGPGGTYAYDARTGRLVWRSNYGQFSNPVVADARRVYLVARSILYGLKERGRRTKRRPARRPQ